MSSIACGGLRCNSRIITVPNESWHGMVSAGTLQDLLSRQMQRGGAKLYSDLDVCR